MVLIFCISGILFPSLLLGQPLDTLKILKISDTDKTAVVRFDGGSLTLIKSGDNISENLVVTDIQAGRIVLQNREGNIPEKIIIRKTGKGQSIKRVRPAPEASGDVLYMPESVPIGAE